MDKESISSVQSLCLARRFATPWTTACQASLCITNSQSFLKLMSIESVVPSNRLILCRPPLLLPSIFPSIRVFSNESALHIRWRKYWSSIGVSLQYFHFHPITPHLVHFFPHTTVHPILPFRASICFNCFITITAE